MKINHNTCGYCLKEYPPLLVFIPKDKFLIDSYHRLCASCYIILHNEMREVKLR